MGRLQLAGRVEARDCKLRNVFVKLNTQSRLMLTKLEYIDNDWSTNLNGEIYRSRISGTGRSDLQRSDRVLIEEIQERVDDTSCCRKL